MLMLTQTRRLPGILLAAGLQQWQLLRRMTKLEMECLHGRMNRPQMKPRHKKLPGILQAVDTASRGSLAVAATLGEEETAMEEAGRRGSAVEAAGHGFGAGQGSPEAGDGQDTSPHRAVESQRSPNAGVGQETSHTKLERAGDHQKQVMARIYTHNWVWGP